MSDHQTTAEIVPIVSKRPVRLSHEFECDTCGYLVFSAIHYGPIRTCLQCQFKLEHGFPIERALEEGA